MIRRTIATIALLAFTNYILGCYSNELITPNVFALTTDAIVQIVLRDGNIVKFDYTKGGGKYSTAEPSLRVRTFAGDTMFLPLSKIEYAYAGKAALTSQENVAGKRVVEIVDKKTKTVFDMNGGMFDSVKGIIGKDIGGEDVFFRLSDMKEIYTIDVTPISKKEILNAPNQPIAEIVTTTGRMTGIDTSARTLVGERKVIAGVTEGGQHVEVGVDNILGAEIRKADTGMSLLAALVGIPMLLGGILFIAVLVNPPRSCPFVYSYDGKQYHFDAEPLGGAICRGLKRTDISRLEHLAATDGSYTLLVRNELDETQHIDEMKLLVAEHSDDQVVLPAADGSLLGLRNVRNATSATDEQGADLMRFFNGNDGAPWQTHLPTASMLTQVPLRHHLTITLPKPRGAKQAHIVHTIGTAMWGATMITKMLEYHGDHVDEWLASLTPGSESYKQLYGFLEREETYYLKLMVQQGETWVHRGTIRGQGPFATEERVTTIDVSDVPGDSLVVQLDPPMGFWTIDYIGVSYDAESILPTEISPRSGENDDGVSITHLITTIDERYYTMPDVGDWTRISFASPPTTGRAPAQTVFLKTTGYYEQHLKKGQPEQPALVKHIIDTPGFISKLAMEEFAKWQKEQLTQN